MITVSRTDNAEWRVIDGFDRYRISDKGEIYSLNKHRVMQPYKNKKGYLKIGLKGNDGEWHKKRVNRLVAETFIDNPNNLPEVNHKDFNKQNNAVDNLEWVTGEDNRKHYWSARAVNE